MDKLLEVETFFELGLLATQEGETFHQHGCILLLCATTLNGIRGMSLHCAMQALLIL